MTQKDQSEDFINENNIQILPFFRPTFAYHAVHVKHSQLLIADVNSVVQLQMAFNVLSMQRQKVLPLQVVRRLPQMMERSSGNILNCPRDFT